MTNVYQQIAGKIDEMSKSQVKIATYILENQSTVPFLTVSKLAKKAGVSDATVVRFATLLGYSGYPEMHKLLQNSVKEQLTTSERLKISQEVYNQEPMGVYEVFQDDMANIHTTMETLDEQAFHQAVESLVSARKIYIIANRSAAALGVFLQYYLEMILENVELLQSLEISSEKLHQLNKKDVVIGISFSRYTKSTVQMFSFAKKKDAKTIAITDNLLSPLVPYADIPLTASSQMPSLIDSFVAPLSLINALIMFVGKEKQEDIHSHLNVLEDIWQHFDIFQNGKMQE
ncbi:MULTISPECIES: MurR/RpiR family transcriptional regulator [Oceanobacillus]|uniref:N-acetylmannosamine kinase n=1 Tax=Oceanobacillus kimchii TaxID=746691 RepID=A0ABQ5TN21_9BACI|nr:MULTISPECIES: MurR/RpiR family transcriptional regulator [Oceanobacillus]MBT2599916.1 MurR/RpiR family transcriptional regulator [Oceanobacillus sp. ISL-74]MBT2652634.1 MurR/RpiR family transcriptional regulator [Oceanobacillus sp. ISL-73]MCT1577176.1 MurR/RpiR family transcriptional regulator [Oceanobacillus kimchii]MCT2135246.1 MurR/RpiR family transcriptional regulator [Oceanobacillus kimchii]OEH56514.1 RpiR family transcriptional regulator [Oceanobacillus sp. E9]